MATSYGETAVFPLLISAIVIFVENGRWRLCYGEGAGCFDGKTAVGITIVQAINHNKTKSKRGLLFFIINVLM